MYAEMYLHVSHTVHPDAFSQDIVARPGRERPWSGGRSYFSYAGLSVRKAVWTRVAPIQVELLHYSALTKHTTTLSSCAAKLVTSPLFVC